MNKLLENFFIYKFCKNLKTFSSCIIVVDKSGIIRNGTNNTYSLTGYALSELKNQSLDKFLPEAVKHKHNDYIKNLTFSNNRTRIMGKKRPIQLLTKENILKNVEITLEKVTIFHNNYTLAFISEFTHLEPVKELIEYRKFFELSNDLYCIVSTNGHIVKANNSFLKNLEYSEEEIYSKPLFDFLYEKDKTITLDEFKKVVSENKIVNNFENRYVTKSGNIIVLQWWGYMYDDSIICVAKNVTTEKEIRQVLVQSKSLTDEAERLSNFGCWKYDIKYNTFFFTNGLKRIYKLNDNILIQYEKFLSFIHHDDKQNVIDVIAKCIDNKVPFEFIAKTIINNSVLYIKTVCQYIENEGEEYIMGISQDVTKIIETQQDLEKSKVLAEEGSKSKTIFLANMSHEIRTPINAIMGMSTLLNTTHLNGEQKEYNNIITDSCGILLSLINNILDLSKIDSGKDSVITEIINIEEFIITLKTIYTRLASQKGIFFNVQLYNVPNFIHADKVKIQQIIVNLLNNAIKFTQKGSVDLILHGEENSAKTQGKLNIIVKDTGIGVSKENQENLFKPFSQADSTTTKQFGGTGLGLAICLKLVKLLDGDINMESEVNIGTTVTVGICYQPYTKSSLLNNISKLDKQTAMVIVEDNKSNQIVLSKYIEKIGIRIPIIIYENGIEAINNIGEVNPVIIFMDLHMPKMNGFDCTEKLRKYGITCPIIAVTANAMEGVKDKCLSIGMNDLILKPYTLTDLSIILEKYNLKKFLKI